MTIGPEVLIGALGILITFLSAYFWYDRNTIQKRMENSEQSFNDAFDRFTLHLQGLQTKIQSIQQELAANRVLNQVKQRPDLSCQAYIRETMLQYRQQLKKEIKYAVMDALKELKKI